MSEAACKCELPESGHNFVCDPADASRKLGNAHVELDLIDFTVKLHDRVNVDIPKLKLLTLHRCNGMIFRGSAGFRGSAWRDWVVADWGRGFEKFPSRMWGLWTHQGSERIKGSTLVGSTISSQGFMLWLNASNMSRIPSTQS